jgi:hypothetical protein
MATSHARQTTDFIEGGLGACLMQRANAYRPRLLQSPGIDVAKSRYSLGYCPKFAAGFTKNYALACFDPPKPRFPTGTSR